MFGADHINNQAPLSTGKKMYGIPNRKAQNSNVIGWNVSQSKNNFQMKKSKNQEITGKITKDFLPKAQSPVYQNQTASYDSKYQQYERMMLQNPDIPAEELEMMLMRYDMKKSPSRGSHIESISSQRIDQRTPILPKESMRDILYSGVGVGIEDHYNRVGSRVSDVLPSEILTYSQKVIIIFKEKDERMIDVQTSNKPNFCIL